MTARDSPVIANGDRRPRAPTISRAIDLADGERMRSSSCVADLVVGANIPRTKSVGTVAIKIARTDASKVRPTQGESLRGMGSTARP
jgi:hypothetical protein